MVPTLLALVGIVATLIGWQVAGQRQRDSLNTYVGHMSEKVADDVGGELDRAIVGAASMSNLVDNTILPAPDDYDRVWSELDDVFAGDASVQVIVIVPTAKLGAVAEHERKTNAGFTYRLLRDPPPADGHLIIVRTSDGSSDIGVDLASLAGIDRRLRAMDIGEKPLFTVERVRTQPNQLLAIERRIGLDHEGDERSIWTAVAIDIDATARTSFDQLPDGYGGQVRLALGPQSDPRGIAANDALAQTSVTSTVDELEFVVDLWADARVVNRTPPEAVLGGGLVATSIAVMALLLFQFVRSMSARVARSDRAARVDALTGLANRRWLFEHLRGLADQPIGLLFCDLDRFKEINDRAGHGAGDDVLVELAQRFTAAADDHVHLARFGGDEFVAVISLDTGIDDAEAIAILAQTATRFIDATAHPFQVGQEQIEIKLSVGSAWRCVPGPTGEELIGWADRAMVLAKRDDLGHVMYDQALRDDELERIRLEGEVAKALDHEDLVVHYQPIVDVAGDAQSYEALVRWRRHDELVPPHVFLPVVEHLGRMADLGWIVMRRAVGEFALAVNGVPSDSRTLHVNVDPTQLLEPDFANNVVALLNTHCLAPDRLVIELVEDEWMESDDAILRAVDRVVRKGIGVAVDDFGSAYSSLARILELRDIVELKLDRSVVANVHRSRNAIFISGLAETTQRLGVTLIAEGVETAEDFAALVDAGIGRFQGYFFGQPGPAENILFLSEPSR